MLASSADRLQQEQWRMRLLDLFRPRRGAVLLRVLAVVVLTMILLGRSRFLPPSLLLPLSRLELCDDSHTQDSPARSHHEASDTTNSNNQSLETATGQEEEEFLFLESNRRFIARQLQALTGMDPTLCAANHHNNDNHAFTCMVPSSFSVGSNSTLVESAISCDLDPDIGFDVTRAENCGCRATLTALASNATRHCACRLCPYDGQSVSTVSLDCRDSPENPFVVGPCVSLSCEGWCNGSSTQNLLPPTPGPLPMDPSVDSSSSSSSPQQHQQQGLLLAETGLPRSYATVLLAAVLAGMHAAL